MALGSKLLVLTVLCMVVLFTVPVHGAWPGEERAVHAYNQHNLYYEDEFDSRAHGQNPLED